MSVRPFTLATAVTIFAGASLGCGPSAKDAQDAMTTLTSNPWYMRLWIFLVEEQSWLFLFVLGTFGGLVVLFLAALTPLSVILAAIRQPFLITLMLIVGLSITWSIAPDMTMRRVIAIYGSGLAGTRAGAAGRQAWAKRIVASRTIPPCSC